AKGFDVVSYLLDGFVDDFQRFFGIFEIVLDIWMHIAVLADERPPGFSEKAENAFDAFAVPGLHSLKGAEEHEVEAERVGSVLVDDDVGIDDVSAAFGHLLSVLAEDDALVKEAWEGF